MHLWKMSKMEVSNNALLCLFIMIQSVVVMVALLFGVSIFTSRYEKYKAVDEMVGEDGYILNAGHLMWAGENPDNMICGEKEEVEELFQGTKATCTYNVWTGYDYKDIWDWYEPKTIAYDEDAAYLYEPDMDDGRWLDKSDMDTTEIEAVITNNSFGIKVGDELKITQNFYGEPFASELTVKIVGIVSDNTDILGAPAVNVEKYDDVRDCFFTYSSEFEEIPVIMFLQKDLRNAENTLLGGANISTAVSGMQFLAFDENITDEEIKAIQDCIMGTKCYLNHSIDKKTFDYNSKLYIWNQLNELIPVFIGLLVLVIMSVVCSSAMMTRAQLRNYAIYYLSGLKWKECIRIQVYQQMLIQGTTYIITILAFSVMYLSGMLKNTLLEFGAEQIFVCALYIVICVLASIVLPAKIINKNSPKNILTSKG